MANALFSAPSLNGTFAPTSVAGQSPYRRLIVNRPSLVGFWRLDSPAGTTDLDQSTKGDNATLGAGVTIMQAAVMPDMDRASLFSGTATGIATVADNAAFHVGDVFTIGFWLKRASTGLGAAVGLIDGVAATSFQIRIETDDNVSVFSRGVGQVARSITPITDTTIWHQFAWVKNGSTFTIFQDGINVTGSASNHAIANANGLAFGAFSGGSNPYPGSLASIAIYSTPLSAAQIANDFQAGHNGVGLWGAAA